MTLRRRLDAGDRRRPSALRAKPHPRCVSFAPAEPPSGLGPLYARLRRNAASSNETEGAGTVKVVGLIAYVVLLVPIYGLPWLGFWLAEAICYALLVAIVLLCSAAR